MQRYMKYCHVDWKSLGNKSFHGPKISYSPLNRLLHLCHTRQTSPSSVPSVPSLGPQSAWRRQIGPRPAEQRWRGRLLAGCYEVLLHLHGWTYTCTVEALVTKSSMVWREGWKIMHDLEGPQTGIGVVPGCCFRFFTSELPGGQLFYRVCVPTRLWNTAVGQRGKLMRVTQIGQDMPRWVCPEIR